MFSRKKPELPVVLAHFMLGNTYSYSDALWTAQLELAAEAGLDGFVLNLGPEDWQWQQALAAARLCPPSFALCLSLDMNVLPSSSAALLVARVATFAQHAGGTHQLRKDGRAVLSTFGGGGLALGGGGWKGLKQRLKEEGVPIYFVPAFFLPPRDILADPAVDACFAWNAGWEQCGPGSGSAEEREFVASKKPYMAAVSPCFSAHYGTVPPWAWDKNFIYGTDDAWYARRWEQVLGAKRPPAFVQVLSWNDYGESHYIGPISGSQPGSEAWTQGMDHLPLLSLTAHFIGRLKGSPASRSTHTTATAATAAGEENVWVWYRPHRASLPPSSAPTDRVGRPSNTSWATDTLSVFSSLSAPAELAVLSGDRSTTLVLPSGEHTTSIPFVPGGQRFAVVCNGAVRAELEGRPIDQDADVRAWNFNVWSGRLRF